MAEFMLRCHGKGLRHEAAFPPGDALQHDPQLDGHDAGRGLLRRLRPVRHDGLGRVLAQLRRRPARRRPNVFKANAIEKIKQVRNHAVRRALVRGERGRSAAARSTTALRADVHTYDGGRPHYQPNSHAGDLSGSGPWHDLDPKQYFQGVPERRQPWAAVRDAERDRHGDGHQLRQLPEVHAPGRLVAARRHVEPALLRTLRRQCRAGRL